MQSIGVLLCNPQTLATNQKVSVWGCALYPLYLYTKFLFVLTIIFCHILPFPRKVLCKVS